MMRGNDEEDMADAEFMICYDRITESQILAAFSEMKPIELVKLRDAFEKAKPIILRLNSPWAQRDLAWFQQPTCSGCHDARCGRNYTR